MVCQEFLKFTVLNLNDLLFFNLKNFLVKENLISFAFLKESDVTKEILTEKLYDFFDKTDSHDKSFDKILKNYCYDLDSAVSPKIPKEQKKKVNGEKTILSARSRKYYNKAIIAKNELNFQNLIDFSRIMMCLYTEIIKNNSSEIENFDYSVGCLNIETIMKSLYEKHTHHVKGLKASHQEFSHSEKCTFIVLTVIFFYIKNNEVKGEY